MGGYRRYIWTCYEASGTPWGEFVYGLLYPSITTSPQLRVLHVADPKALHSILIKDAEHFPKKVEPAT